MRKVVIHRPGDYRRLEIETHDDPRPKGSEVVVDVTAIGVNYADVIVRMGLYSSAKEYVGWPITPGFEFAGRVLEVGPEHDTFALSQRVFGVTRFDAYADRVCVPSHQLFPIPNGFTDEQAAAFPTVFLTASYGLLELAHPLEGQSILVHSAAGGVGSALLQLGRLAKCRVLGVVGSAHKRPFAQDLGADVVVDKSSQDLWPTIEGHCPSGCDIILDANGVSTLKESYRHLAPGGKLVVYGFHSMFPKRGGKVRWPSMIRDYLRTPRFAPLDMTQRNRSVLAFNLSYLFDRADLLERHMSQLLAWIERGAITPPHVHAYAFEDVASAHRDLESGETIGKLVLRTS